MTVHLGSLDHIEHSTGPFSKDSNEALEQIDEMAGRLYRAVIANDPSSVVAIVSDHGFMSVSHHINLIAAFVNEGLIKLKPAGDPAEPRQVASWDAGPWPAGGVAAIMLRDPGDSVVRSRVKNFLLRLKDDPNLQIARVIEQPELTAIGGYPEAAFLVEMKPGADVGSTFAGPIVEASGGTGQHGYLPDRPEMRASFFVAGQGIASGRNLGVVDMRQIAPTIAKILGINLPTAKGQKLDILQR
jgi:predicted AlkP superfamily pyrophosphatase or phosphodiesterase